MNLIKSNEITKNLINSLKLTYYNNILDVTMYKKLLSFTNEKILLKDIVITGEDLKIIYIDKYQIKISGIVNMVKGN